MIRTVCAFLAMLLTGIQAFLLFTKGNGICFNDGCEIVEKLTIVPPLYFNLLGAFCFGFVFLGSLISCINESRSSERYTRLLLTASLAAEAVLIFFQWSVAHAFCSYCLIVFSFVLLLNLLSGWQQIVRGLVVFCAVLIACFSLQFDAGGMGKSLNLGTMARYTEEGNDKNLLLIFSKTCPHCEKVIEFLREESFCNISFNPIEKIEDFSFENIEVNKHYDPRANIGFMRSIGIGGIPILIIPREAGEGVRILNGTDEIMPYLQENCRQDVSRGSEKLPENGMSTIPKKEFQLPMTQEKDSDKCQSESDC